MFGIDISAGQVGMDLARPSLQGSVPRWDVHQFTSRSIVAGYSVDGNYSPHAVIDLFGGSMVRLIKAAEGNINTRHGEDAGRSFPHVGIDIGWGGGTELYAPAAGWITWAWVGTYGNRCIIRHDDNTWSLIAHAETFFGENGREVEQGEHIGTMGRTGGPWGSIAGWFVHCHQEYHLANGVAVDPLDYMSGSGLAGELGPEIEDEMSPEQEADLKRARDAAESALWLVLQIKPVADALNSRLGGFDLTNWAVAERLKPGMQQALAMLTAIDSGDLTEDEFKRLLEEQSAADAQAVADAVGAKVPQVDAIADAIIARLPEGSNITPAAIAKEFAEEFAKRLAEPIDTSPAA